MDYDAEIFRVLIRIRILEAKKCKLKHIKKSNGNFCFFGTADILLPWNVPVNLHWQHKITHKNSFKLFYLDFNEHFRFK